MLRVTNSLFRKEVFLVTIIMICRLWIVFAGIISLSCTNSISSTKGSENISLLTGDWMITPPTFSPLMIIPNCKPIQHGSTFQFTQDTLKVYLDASQNPCDVYTFKISGNTISLIQADMIWLCTYEINNDTLRLISNHFLIPYEGNTSKPVNSPPATEKIVVTFKKKNT